MPRFIGRDARQGVTHIQNNALPFRAGMLAQRVRLTHAQQARMPAQQIMVSLDTTDRGGPRQRAKRWYRWFASCEAINDCPRSTRNMMDRAGLLGPVRA